MIKTRPGNNNTLTPSDEKIDEEYIWDIVEKELSSFHKTKEGPTNDGNLKNTDFLALIQDGKNLKYDEWMNLIDYID